MHPQGLAVIQLHQPVYSGVSADGCYRRPHVLQIPHLDGAVVTPWNHIVTHREHCWRHRAAKDGHKKTPVGLQRHVILDHFSEIHTVLYNPIQVQWKELTEVQFQL